MPINRLKSLTQKDTTKLENRLEFSYGAVRFPRKSGRWFRQPGWLRLMLGEFKSEVQL